MMVNNREGWYWRADATHNTFVSMFNTDTEPATVEISLDYVASGQVGSYNVGKRTLAPRSTEVVNVGQIVGSGLPDAGGNLIPAGVTSGGYHVRKTGPRLGKTVTTEALVFDTQKKNFVTFYNTCCGYRKNPKITPSGFVGPTGFIGNITITAVTFCGGQYVDITDSGTFSSENTSVCTLDNFGGVTGISVGFTNSDVLLTYPEQTVYDYCNEWEESAALPTNVTPRIYFAGNDITNTTQSVVVGQRIALSTSYTLPSGVTVQSQSWSVSGTTVGGYAASTSSGATIPTNFTQGSTTFYWVAPGNGLNVTFTLNLSNGSSPTARATFNVAGPSGARVTTALGTININNNTLVFGGSGTNIGINFTASATPPPGYSNTFVWVQLIGSRTVTLTGPQSYTCTAAGLDGAYPYPPVTSTSTNDNPDVGLSTAYTEESYNMSPQMYLMWSSGLANSIPVPLGSVSWQWFGDAVYSATTGTWSLQPSSSASANAFQPSTSYPVWTTLAPSPVQCP